MATLQKGYTMQSKQFHIGDVLSITTGALVSPRGRSGLHDILNFMTDDETPNNLRLLNAIEECKPYLLSQFPQLQEPGIDTAVRDLRQMVKKSNDSRPTHSIVMDWLSKLVAGGYGVKLDKMMIINRLPEGYHQDNIEIRCKVPSL